MRREEALQVAGKLQMFEKSKLWLKEHQMRYLRFVPAFWALSLILTAPFGLALAGEYSTIDG